MCWPLQQPAIQPAAGAPAAARHASAVPGAPASPATHKPSPCTSDARQHAGCRLRSNVCSAAGSRWRMAQRPRTPVWDTCQRTNQLKPLPQCPAHDCTANCKSDASPGVPQPGQSAALKGQGRHPGGLAEPQHLSGPGRRQVPAPALRWAAALQVLPAAQLCG